MIFLKQKTQSSWLTDAQAPPITLQCNLLIRNGNQKISFSFNFQFSRSVVSDSLQPHGLLHARLPCPSPAPRAYSNSCPSSQWCHLIISSAAVPSSSCLQSFLSSGSKESVLWIRWPEYWNFSISPSNEYLGLISFRIDWLDLLAVQGTLKSFLQHHSSKTSILQRSVFFMAQLSHPYMTTGKTELWLNRPLLAKWCLCFLICHLGWS